VIHQSDLASNKALSSFLMRGALALFLLLGWLSMNSNGQTQSGNPATRTFTRATHVLGFEGMKRKVGGDISIEGGNLRFQPSVVAKCVDPDATHAAQISISSIQNVSLGEQDKQVGGTPMTLGKAAVPFGGGRVISLFSHKKYDTVAIEYLDGNGGFHGLIFRMDKGQGEALKNSLVAHGAHIATSDNPSTVQSGPDDPADGRKWSIQVDRVDPGATAVSPAFSEAIYENLVQELNKSKQFEHVFRSGDRNANHLSGVLKLRTVVEF